MIYSFYLPKPDIPDVDTTVSWPDGHTDGELQLQHGHRVAMSKLELTRRFILAKSVIKRSFVLRGWFEVHTRPSALN